MTVERLKEIVYIHPLAPAHSMRRLGISGSARAPLRQVDRLEQYQILGVNRSIGR